MMYQPFVSTQIIKSNSGFTDQFINSYMHVYMDVYNFSKNNFPSLSIKCIVGLKI